MQNSPLSDRTLEQLEDEMISLSQRINASEYEFLVLVLEFDIRQGWKAYLFNNCAEWLNMKCGIAPGTAREKVRVATALFDLPKTSSAFAEGKLSYSKARALTRVADRHNEEELLEYAIPATASQVEEFGRSLRNAKRRISTDDVNRIHRSRYLSCYQHSDGSATINAELTKEAADLVMKALEIVTTEQQRNGNADTEDSLFARQADALVAMAQSYLAGGSEEATSTADHYQVVVHVDESALRDEGGKSELPIESVRRISCDSSLVTVTEDENGDPLNVGRKHRVVSPQLKRALLSRDKTCRYPGCTHDRWLDAHHVMHWIDGGETSLANTILLCSRHHQLLHEGGFTIHKNFEGRWYFRNSNGKIIPEGSVYKPILYDASRDAFVGQDCIREPAKIFYIQPFLNCVETDTSAMRV